MRVAYEFSDGILPSDNHYRNIPTPDIIKQDKERYHEGLQRSLKQQFNHTAQCYETTIEKKRTLYPYQKALQKQVRSKNVNAKLVIHYGKWLGSPRDVGFKLESETRRDLLASSFRAKNKEMFPKYGRGLPVRTPRRTNDVPISSKPESPKSSARSSKQ